MMLALNLLPRDEKAAIAKAISARAHKAAYMRKWNAAHPGYGRDRKQKWHLDNIESERARKQEWRRNNPDIRDRSNRDPEVRRAQYVKHKYGISGHDEKALLEKQNGVCAICFGGPNGTGTVAARLHIDHDHATGKVRGLLCWKCNISLGHMRESIPALERMIGYLKR